MINWEDVGPKLIGVFSGIALASKRPGWSVRWADEKAGFISPEVQGEVTLRVVTEGDIGDPESRQIEITTGPNTGLIREYLVGQRRVVIEVQCIALDHTMTTWSWTTAGRIRTRLSRAKVGDDLLASNISVTEVGDSRNVTFTRDSRRVNATIFEVTFAVGYETDHSTDDADETLDVIETIVATSELKNPDGSASGANFINVTMP